MRHAINGIQNTFDLFLCDTLYVIIGAWVPHGHPWEVEAAFIDLFNDVNSAILNRIDQKNWTEYWRHLTLSQKDLDEFESNRDLTLPINWVWTVWALLFFSVWWLTQTCCNRLNQSWVYILATSIVQEVKETIKSFVHEWIFKCVVSKPVSRTQVLF